MIAHLLNLCGMYLGQEDDLVDSDRGILAAKQEDNPEGYLENTKFLQINNEILQRMGGTAYEPPALTPGWSSDRRLDDLKVRARDLIQQFQSAEWWGWEDPQTSLTIEFWQTLIPDLKVVVCVRNPLEVSESLLQRNQDETREFGLNLWQNYYKCFLSTVGDALYCITNYATYFYDPDAELRNLLTFLGANVEDALIQNALTSVAPGMYRELLPESLLDRYTEIKEIYTTLNQRSKIYQSMIADTEFQSRMLEKSASALFDKLKQKENQLAEIRNEAQQALRGYQSHIQELERNIRELEQKVRQLHEFNLQQEEIFAAAMLENETAPQVPFELIGQQLGKETRSVDDIINIIHSPDAALASKFLFRAIVPLKIRLLLKDFRTR
ncbi:MAG: hypothetical protein K8L99_21165 [Anaerolineae bacterium]|nr:hypothetical protein [Anaerolineae bacterium]